MKSLLCICNASLKTGKHRSPDECIAIMVDRFPATARASHGAHLSGALVMVRILLFDYVDHTVTANHVQPLALCVVEKIVGVARDG